MDQNEDNTARNLEDEFLKEHGYVNFPVPFTKDNMEIALAHYYRWRREKERKEFILKLAKQSAEKPWWVWNQWNIGWLCITQDFEKIQFDFMIDFAWMKHERPLIGIAFLFWNIELTLGK